MIGALYVVLLGLSAALYLDSQSKQRDVYIWRVSITSMAVIGFVAWWNDGWKAYCLGGVVVAGLMVVANGGWPKKGGDDESLGTWTGSGALLAFCLAMGAYIIIVSMLASPEPKPPEWFYVWAAIIVVCLLLTYTKRGSWLWSEMMKHQSMR